MKEKILLFGLFISLLASNVIGASCDQKQIDYFISVGQFENAAICFNAIKDYDNAINYTLKAIETNEKLGLNNSIASQHILVAEYYSKKGNGYTREIGEQCDLAETLFLQEISKEINKGENGYSSIQFYYGSLADCYQYMGDIDKSCDYCKKSNEYREKEGEVDAQDCSFYGCPKSSNALIPSGSDSSNASGGFSVIYLVLGGLLVLLILTGAFFLTKKKK